MSLAKSNHHTLKAEQYLEEYTNWDNFCALVGADNLEVCKDKVTVTYDLRDYDLVFGDWVVQYPDGSLHMFSKKVFDELYSNPMAEPFSDRELANLTGGASR